MEVCGRKLRIQDVPNSDQGTGLFTWVGKVLLPEFQMPTGVDEWTFACKSDMLFSRQQMDFVVVIIMCRLGRFLNQN